MAQALGRLPIYAAAILLWTLRGRRAFERATRGITDGWRLLALFSVLLCAGVSALTLLVFPPEPPDGGAGRFGGIACVMCIVAAAHIVLFKTIALMNRQNEVEQLRMVRWLLESELAAEQEYVSQARRHRHDLRHHARLLLSLAEEGDLAGIRRYLAGYGDELERSALPAFTRHTVANALLRNFVRQCADAGIACEVRGGIPEHIPLSDVEACSLFGNLLENALLACRACTGARFSLRAEVRAGCLYVQTRNSVAGTVRFKDDLPLSSRNGGTGARSIRDVLARHGGMADFSQEGGEFRVKIILPL